LLPLFPTKQHSYQSIRFLGSVKISTLPFSPLDEKKQGDISPNGSAGYTRAESSTEALKSPRLTFLPLDRHDGSNPRIKIDRLLPGVFVYRFSQDFNYTNANHYIDHMIGVILAETGPTNRSGLTKPGVSCSLLHECTRLI
jgi:sodium-independent sulfate anion transporter 11